MEAGHLTLIGHDKTVEDAVSVDSSVFTIPRRRVQCYNPLIFLRDPSVPVVTVEIVIMHIVIMH